MSYRKLIEKQLNSAFRRVGDLAKDVILMPKAAKEFDFSSADVETEDGRPRTVKAIVTEIKEPLKYRRGELVQLIFKSKDLDLGAYSQVEVEKVSYNIVFPIVDQFETISIVNAVRA